MKNASCDEETKKTLMSSTCLSILNGSREMRQMSNHFMMIRRETIIVMNERSTRVSMAHPIINIHDEFSFCSLESCQLDCGN